ncbi:TetR/AcrR family transcriptional regulator [Phaeovulum sp. W22_SRMD_FR3]|uniref:TetR/AcrR family transcriptional regulator n=1 Tax=Phaeovulum sp. W22_SRMD_FR3 TaxID=3240274 RepID=UPI003F964EEB
MSYDSAAPSSEPETDGAGPLRPESSVPDSRSAEILHAVRQAFAEKGFDGASMQDLARAVGMSVGNFYRYFPSKADIIAQMIAIDMQELSAEFAMILQAPDTVAALRQTIRRHMQEEQCDQEGALWAEITAAAVRKPDVAALVRQMDHQIIDYLAQIFAKIAGVTPAVAAAQFTAHGTLIIMLFKGCMMMMPGDPKAQAALQALVLRTIDCILNEILVLSKELPNDPAPLD